MNSKEILSMIADDMIHASGTSEGAEKGWETRHGSGKAKWNSEKVGEKLGGDESVSRTPFKMHEDNKDYAAIQKTPDSAYENARLVRVNLKNLHTGQHTLDNSIVSKYANLDPRERTELPKVENKNGKFWIADGHHRLAADLLNGKTHSHVLMLNAPVSLSASIPSDAILADIVRADSAGHPYRGNQHDEPQDAATHATAAMAEHDGIRSNQQISEPYSYMAHTASIAAYQASKDIPSGKVIHSEAAAAHDVAAKLHRELGNSEYAEKHDRMAGYHNAKVQARRLASSEDVIMAGDVAGHEFHGNQWTGAIGVGEGHIKLRNAQITRETEKAALVKVQLQEGKKEIWFPKSHVSVDEQGGVHASQWIIDQKHQEFDRADNPDLRGETIQTGDKPAELTPEQKAEQEANWKKYSEERAARDAKNQAARERRRADKEAAKTPEQKAAEQKAVSDREAAANQEYLRQKAAMKANMEHPGKENAEKRAARTSELLNSPDWVKFQLSKKP